MFRSFILILYFISLNQPTSVSGCLSLRNQVYIFIDLKNFKIM